MEAKEEEISPGSPGPSSEVATREEKKKTGAYIEAATLLSHVKMLESKLPEDETQFGHPEPPQISMCRVPTKEPGIVAMMAVTKRCISVVLLKESIKGSTMGTPVEVLVMQGEDQITCSTILALEVPKLSASDKLIVPDRNEGQSQGISLMSGGLVPVAPSPRVAVVVGTDHGRVIAVEFSVKPKSLHLTRRNYYAGNEVLTYYEPLPYATLTSFQRSHRRGMPGPEGGKPRRVVPFEPSEGVSTLVPYGIVRDGRAMTHVWISFGDGTSVRVHHAAFFASVIEKHTESQPNAKTLENILGEKIVRWEAMLPPLVATNFTLVPIPKYHPSPLAPFPAWKKPEFDDIGGGNDVSSRRPAEPENYEAVVYCSGAMVESFPTLAFYTSEDQFEGRTEEPEDDDEEQEVSNGIITSVIGGIFGILTGGRSAPKPPQKEEGVLDVVASTKQEEWDPMVPFPSINLEPFKLYAGCEIHDPPRQVTHCTVDPDGDLAAIADTLGRVSLIDLSTKQIVRMWKGFRDTSCYWMEIPRKAQVKPGQKAKTLYLVVHSRQRKVVEIWRTRHGPKVKSMQVHREAQVVSIREMSHVGYVASCYLAHSNVPSSKMNQIERIRINEDESAGITNSERNRQPRPDSSIIPQDAAARLNRLKQLLSDTNVECQPVDVFKALEKIKSVEDLATALDTLAFSPTLEEKMGVEGSTFQKLAVSHCKQKLDEAINAAGKEAFTNPHVQHLAFKIAYYTQVSKAYDVLHNHETNMDTGVRSTGVLAPSSWGLEGIGWTSVYEKITKKMIDDGIPQVGAQPMRFYEFAGTLEPPKKYMEEDFVIDSGGYKVYFSDSTRSRREILVRIFKPLLGDVFSFSAVSQIFEALGTKGDGEYVMKCFGEWFSSLSVREVTKKAIFAEDSPVKRWLQERITAQFSESSDGEKQPMESIYQYCRKSEELVRAFWLAALCHESMSHAAKGQEEKTYGKVSKDLLVGRWESLLRQLRVCMLVSFRLNGIQLGALPISVDDVDRGEEFSVFEWLAHDELMMSHKHDEIVSLENACRLSSHSFDASTAEADSPSRWKALQTSCLSAALSHEERDEYLVDIQDDDRLGALLLYLKQNNIGKVLVAHRALLLAAKWGRQPDELDILQDALVALKAIPVEEHKRISSAVRLEIWQTRIRPVYRALMFGFDDVQEVSFEVVSPLFRDVEWVKTFSEITSTVLAMLNELEWHEAENMNLRKGYIKKAGDDSWPTPTECPILAKLIDKNKKIRISAFEAHQMLMTALKVTQDFPKLARCIPSFYDLFTSSSLFQKTIPVPDAEENQQALMQDAVVAFARHYNGPNMDTLELGDIQILSELFEFEMDNIRTLFLLAMYEFGKDRMVDEIITRSAPAISVVHFCDGGVEIVCRRLNQLLHADPSDEMKSIMGTLDANMCEWIKEKAETSESLVQNADMAVPPGNTHLFALRLLSLGASADIKKSERIKIHSLIVLSGSIVKGLEALQHENRSTDLELDLPPPPSPERSIVPAIEDDKNTSVDKDDSEKDGIAVALKDPWLVFAGEETEGDGTLTKDEVGAASSKEPSHDMFAEGESNIDRSAGIDDVSDDHSRYILSTGSDKDLGDDEIDRIVHDSTDSFGFSRNSSSDSSDAGDPDFSNHSPMEDDSIQSDP